MSHDTAPAMNTDDKLVYMANQIAAFFNAMPYEEAVAGVAKHINDFWDPRMRQKLRALIDGENTGLSPLVLSAAANIRWPEPAKG